jgi:uncharacterized protein (TIGR03085 family)
VTRARNALARRERDALADLLLVLGPDEPTLCEGWSTRDLAAHLVARATRPDAAAGLVLPPLRGHLERVQSGIATRDWEDLVAAVRQGPPTWSLQALPLLDYETNTIEYVVHLEDVRRAQTEWEPRTLDDDDLADLWTSLTRWSRVHLARAPVGVVAIPTDGPKVGTHVVLHSRIPQVTLVGPVVEIVLAMYGRVTRGLEVRGDDEHVAGFHGFPRA